MFGLSGRYCPQLHTIEAALAHVRPLFTKFMVQVVCEYELHGNNNIQNDYLINVEEL
jgi:hypothetical protein